MQIQHSEINRRLPPHELNARRRRKRNLNELPNVKLTGEPVHVAAPKVVKELPIPAAAPESLATRLPVSDFS